MKSIQQIFFAATVLIFSINIVTHAQHPVYKEVEHILWVVNNLKKTQKGWNEIGFHQMKPMKKVRLISHGLDDDKGKIRATTAYLGGTSALWVQPLRGDNILTRYMERNGEGAAALIHRVDDEAQLFELTQDLARKNIGKIATFTIETETGDMQYTIMDTREKGKYYLGFVIDGRSDAGPMPGDNDMNLRFNQYAFAVKAEQPASDFWAKAGLPAFEITHPEVSDKEYFGMKADFEMDLGWQRHGEVVYEWCIPLKGPNVYQDHIRMHGEGIQHFGFAVEDMDQAIDFFREKGYKISMSGGWGDKGTPGSGRFAYVDLSSIGGMTMELLWNYRE